MVIPVTILSKFLCQSYRHFVEQRKKSKEHYSFLTKSAQRNRPNRPCCVLYAAVVRLRLAVVIDADEQQAVGVFGQLGGVLAALNLVDGRVGILIILQLQHDGGRVDVLARDEHQDGKALTRGLLLPTSISPDLSTYSPLRTDWNPALPILIYVPIIFTLIRKLSNDSAKIQYKSNEGKRKGQKSAKISQKIRLRRYFC